MKASNLEIYVNQLLQINLFQDYAPNGLQIEGREEVSKIASAVTASLEVIQQCVDHRLMHCLFITAIFGKANHLLFEVSKKIVLRC